MAGNLMADFVKGNAIDLLPAAVQAGVRFHRAVDRFTDEHPLHVQSRRRLGREWGRVSGILIDIYYDHLLARHWNRFAPHPLRLWLDRAYARFLPCCLTLPSRYHATGLRLVRDDLLMTYAEAQGVEQALERLSRRLAKGHFSLERAMPVLAAADEGLEEDFLRFFPELCAFAGVRSHAPARE